ncbi:WXG100 family type VII secretion target [Micromonospora sp. WMMD812]|uniref:WXG100 family type VII secretion target n=1 Tax=Micromonospora sp. WMMD812 TaxID=3015152 RepID=UPI00248BBA37|nr:WXG100 family type VII secretion target [Micromonospora sp. WMMD812]WBB65287.1 WXG100 family type VII secretion target [Micromonospora sp. WMMD812]
MSEYVQRYQGVSHQELYDAVMAGKPEQIDGVAAQWSSLKGILDGLGRDLSGDLEKLANTWTGSAGQEFQRRLTLVVGYAGTLGEGMDDVKQALTMMAGQLRTAHKQAESPEETDDHDQAVNGALKGAVFGVPGIVVGGLLGHQQDKEEQEKAHQRMVNVVAELAAGYDLSAYGRVVTPPPPHPDTPGAVDGTGSTPRSGPAVGTPASGPGSTGLNPHTGGATVATPDRVGAGPEGGRGGDLPETTVGGGTGGLAGPGATDPDAGTSLAGANQLAGGPLVSGTGLGAGPGTTVASANPGTGLLFGATGGAPAGGLVGTGALASSAGSPTTTSGRPTGAPAPTENRSATGVGRSMDGRRGDGAGRGGNRPGVLGGRGHDEDETDERLTWLTEDEMVWQDGKAAPPPVLGTAD